MLEGGSDGVPCLLKVVAGGQGRVEDADAGGEVLGRGPTSGR